MALLIRYTAPIEDRAANIKERVRSIIDRGYEDICNALDDLHKRNINDDDVVTALRQLDEIDILEYYADWAEIDLREDNNTTLDPIVPDPGDADSYKALVAKYANDKTPGVLDADLERLKRALTLGTWVLYRESNSAAPLRAFTTGPVSVAGGVPVVPLIAPGGRIIKAAALSHVDIVPLSPEEI